MIRRWAKLDENNIVTDVTVGDSAEWLVETLGGVWVETFKDASQKFHYAGRGFSYSADLDAFIPPKPYESWILDEDTCLWQAPVPMPEDGDYTWNEETQAWDAVSEA